MPQQITESSALTELAEASQVKTGRLLVQAISAGHGSSGYYSPQVLEQAAQDRLITRGTPLHLDHATESEHRDRPERSVQTIAGVFTGDAAWDAQRQALVGEVQIFSPHRERLSEMAPYIGLSISGSATDVVEGEVEGKPVRVIEGLAAIDSVDFVVRAGRGGKVLTNEAEAPAEGLLKHLDGTYGLALRESGLAISPIGTTPIVPSPPAGQPTTESSQEMNMPQIEEARLRELTEAEGKVSVLESERDAAKSRADAAEANLGIHRAATERALAGLAESTLPPKMVKRVLREALADLPVKDGALDVEEFDARFKESREDFESLLTEAGTGRVVGFGQAARVVESVNGFDQSEEARKRVPFNRPAAQKG